MKSYVKIGYTRFIIPDSLSRGELAKNLAMLTPVEEKEYNGETVWTPLEKGIDLQFGVILEDKLRKPTQEEKENEELRSAKSMEKYYRERAEQLECDIKLLKREQGEEE